MRISTLFSLAFLVLFVSVSRAGDQFPHLTPCEDVLSDYQFRVDYHLSVRKILYASLSRDPYFRMTVLPSFTPEWVVEIQDPIREVATVKYAVVDGKIWSNDAPEKLRVIERSIQISSELAQLLKQLLDKHLDGVRYAYSESLGLDGTTYHFSNFRTGIGVRTGQTWSPEPQWPTDRLVKVTELLRDLTLVHQDRWNN